ncbi:MAG: Smr/MutS family protein [Alphaproteobacteria bacterium]
MSKKRENNNGDPESDCALWDIYVEDVQPIRRNAVSKKAAITENKQIDDCVETVKHSANKKSEGSAYQPPLSSPQTKITTDAASPQLDKRTAQKLKRGQFPIEDKIDLHGMTQDAACAALQAFIARAYARQLRCVLVVTGKGRLVLDRDDDSAYVQTRTPGVIKRNFKSWLTGEPYRSMILKIETAQIKDGGEGAAYILLRRQR